MSICRVVDIDNLAAGSQHRHVRSLGHRRGPVPDTSAIDRGAKLRDHFPVQSLHHYLIVWPELPRSGRLLGGDAATEVFTTGPIALDAPGITVMVAGFDIDWPRGFRLASGASG